MCAGSRAPGANLGRFNARLCQQRQRNASCGAKKRCGKLTELWKNQRTVFPQLLEPSVHSFPQRRLLLEFRTQHFFYSSTATCQDCPLRSQCVLGKGPRTISIQAEEGLQQQARAHNQTEAGRKSLRE